MPEEVGVKPSEQPPKHEDLYRSDCERLERFRLQMATLAAQWPALFAGALFSGLGIGLLDKVSSPWYLYALFVLAMVTIAIALLTHLTSFHCGERTAAAFIAICHKHYNTKTGHFNANQAYKDQATVRIGQITDWLRDVSLYALWLGTLSVVLILSILSCEAKNGKSRSPSPSLSPPSATPVSPSASP